MKNKFKVNEEIIVINKGIFIYGVEGVVTKTPCENENRYTIWVNKLPYNSLYLLYEFEIAHLKLKSFL